MITAGSSLRINIVNVVRARHTLKYCKSHFETACLTHKQEKKLSGTYDKRHEIHNVKNMQTLKKDKRKKTSESNCVFK